MDNCVSERQCQSEEAFLHCRLGIQSIFAKIGCSNTAKASLVFSGMRINHMKELCTCLLCCKKCKLILVL